MARKATARKTTPKPTGAQRLGGLIKSARDIMRKDKGLNGDLDRLPMLTWVMFLKFLDDLEQIEESRAKLGGKRFRTSIGVLKAANGIGNANRIYRGQVLHIPAGH